MIESFIVPVKKHLDIPCKILATVLLLTISILQSTTSAAAANALILDTGQPGTSFSGTWKVSGGVDSYGSKSLYASANGASYTFNVDLATPGEYHVFAWWTEYPSRRTSVPYDIIHETGTSTVNVNQQQNGGTWQKLGSTWTFNNQATIRIRSLGNGSTSADAIKLVYVGNNTALPASPDDLSGSTPELDTGQPGTSFSGTWKVSGGVDSYGSKSLYASANGASYTFNVDLATPGEYQVFAWWTEYPSRRTSVPYDIIHETGTSTVNVNQQQNGGTWQKLGSTWTFNNQATIRIRSLGNGSTSADAIKLVYVGNNTASPAVGNNTALPASPDDLSGSTPELDTGQPGTSFSGTWKVSGGVDSYGSKSLYASANGASYTFNVDLATPGEYQVFAWWTEYPSRRTSVPYDIIHETGTSTVNVNQQQNGGTWQKLGSTWTFNNQATIRIRSLGNGSTSADAIKLVYVGNNTNTASQTGSAVLNWTAPVARDDGTALALSEIAGYTVYYGTSTGSHPNRLNVDDGSATSATITDLLLGTYYIAVTTRDYEGRESSYSDEVVKIVN